MLTLADGEMIAQTLAIVNYFGKVSGMEGEGRDYIVSQMLIGEVCVRGAGPDTHPHLPRLPLPWHCMVPLPRPEARRALTPAARAPLQAPSA